MSLSLENIMHRAAAQESHTTAARRPASDAAGFQKLLLSSAASTSSAPATSTPAKFPISAAALTNSLATSVGPSATATRAAETTTADDGLKHLGPFTGDPNTKAAEPIADPAPMPTAAYTPLPASQQALLTQPWDPFNKSQHEATMNNWYMKVTQNSNQQKLQIYQQGVADWKTNSAHCQDLGMQPPPPPTPPVLEAVGPLPDGYWFATHA